MGVGKGGLVGLDLGGLQHMMVENYQPVAEGKGQHLSADIAPGLRVWADRELLTQMLANLIENAIRHSDEGAVITVAGTGAGGQDRGAITGFGPGNSAPPRANGGSRLFLLQASRAAPPPRPGPPPPPARRGL